MSDTATPASPSALDVFRGDTPTIVDAIRTRFLIRAITDEAKDRQKAVDAFIDEHAGPGYSQKVPGIGRLAVSAPEPQPVISDATALGQWIEDQYGGEIEGMEVRDGIDGKIVESACAGDPELAAKIAELIPAANRHTYYLDGDLADKLARRYGRTDPVTGALFEGPLADDDGVVIPGVDVRVKASSKVSFTPDKESLAAARDRLAGRHPELSL